MPNASHCSLEAAKKNQKYPSLFPFIYALGRVNQIIALNQFAPPSDCFDSPHRPRRTTMTRSSDSDG
ncbi:hypothetical protein CFE70_002341 [Pyrenophora teres f. teres 0-1]